MDFILNLIVALLSFFYINDGNYEDEFIPELSGDLYQVVRVIDGDTIVVRLDSGTEKSVRYIGIDTPEPYRDAEPACFSLEASLMNRQLVQGKMVRLEGGVENQDRYDRWLRYVYVDDLFVNEILIKNGYAKSLAIAPNTLYAAEFRVLESIAKESNLGLWGACE